jgi:hypothetical protein
MPPKPHSPTEPEHPGSPSGDDVREPPVPSTEGKEDKFPRKAGSSPRSVGSIRQGRHGFVGRILVLEIPIEHRQRLDRTE